MHTADMISHGHYNISSHYGQEQIITIIIMKNSLQIILQVLEFGIMCLEQKEVIELIEKH